MIVYWILDIDGDGAADGTAGATSASAVDSVACGNAATATADSVAIGDGATITAPLGRSVAIGTAATASYNSVAIGKDAEASAFFGGVAVGKEAKTLSNNTVAIGQFTNIDSSSSRAVTLGYRAKAVGAPDGIAIGSDSNLDQIGTQSLNQGAIAIGSETIASGFVSIAVGQDALASGNDSIALGRSTIAASEDSTVLGSRASNNFSDHSIVLGRLALANNAPGGIAIGGDKNLDGAGAQVLADGAIAIGADVVNNVPNSMKIAVPLRIEAMDKEMFLLENTNATNAIRRVMKMSNKGPVGFEMEDRDLSKTWQFRSDGAGNFIINNPAHAGAEFKVFGSNGNVNVKGSVTANGILLTSSRASKTDFSELKTSDVMEKLKKIEVKEWRYKAADKNDRHISPMAEDFYSLFQLGPDNKHINPNDLASVALIAAKELQKRAKIANVETLALKVETLDLKTETTKLHAETVNLKTENTLLKQRLASLEKLVINLASGEGLMPKNGNSISFK